MAVKKIEGTMNVVEAAEKRIKNVFSNGVKVYLCFSGGKDTLCMCNIIYELAVKGEIDPKILVCVFIDEEAIYPSMYEMAIRWRKKFIKLGAEFRWYCLPLYQVSMLHHLQDDESWITWEPGKEDVWMRDAPPFAIFRDPALKTVGQTNYQGFLPKICMDGIMLVGVRASESLQRVKYLSEMDMSRCGISGSNKIYPIYDWSDSDVWLYIKERHLDFPQSYIDLYRVGVNKRSLRLSNFFGGESIAGLRYISETDPQLWDRILKREPNAYLALLYWDSEMFHRSTNKRRKLEGTEPTKDYRALCKKILFEEPEKHFTNPKAKKVCQSYQRLYIKAYGVMEEKHFKSMYESVTAGDPKLRSLRAIYTNIYTDYLKKSKPSKKGGEK